MMPILKRPATTIVAAAMLALLTAACTGTSSAGSGDSPSTGHSASSSDSGGPVNAKLLAFSQCMRAHGVPNFPDPEPGATNEKFPSAQQLGVGSSQLNTADQACQHLLPAGVGDQFPQSEIPLLLAGMTRFSQCMRAHGVPDWPDPSVDPQGRPIFSLSGAGISLRESHSAQLGTKMRECGHLLPHALGGIPLG
jgi:hypothetical protein